MDNTKYHWVTEPANAIKKKKNFPYIFGEQVFCCK